MNKKIVFMMGVLQAQAKFLYKKLIKYKNKSEFAFKKVKHSQII